MQGTCYSATVSNVQVKNLDNEMHQLLRSRAQDEGSTISEYVLGLIRRDLRRPTRRRWVESVAQLAKHDFSREEISDSLDRERPNQ